METSNLQNVYTIVLPEKDMELIQLINGHPGVNNTCDRLIDIISRLQKSLEQAVQQRDSYAADNAFLYGSDTYDVVEENLELQKIVEGK